MNTLQSDNHQHFVLSIIVGVGACLLLVISLIFIVHIEEQARVQKRTALPSPQAIARQEGVPIITPIPSYAPRIPGMSKEGAFKLFKTDTFDKDIYNSDKHLVRWEQETIPWHLRGQFTPEDTQCMQSIAKQFNSAMQTATLTEQPTSSGGRSIEIYILPSNQFSSVNPDIRPDKAAQMFYTLSGYTLSSIDILVDINQSTDFRCYYLQSLMLQSVGLANPILGNTIRAQIDDIDLEMLRILYSPLLTAGLTQREAERRIVR